MHRQPRQGLKLTRVTLPFPPQETAAALRWCGGKVQRKPMGGALHEQEPILSRGEVEKLGLLPGL